MYQYLLNVSIGGGEVDGYLTLNTVRHAAQPSNQLSDAAHDPAAGVLVIKSPREERCYLLQHIFRVHVFKYVGILTNHLRGRVMSKVAFKGIPYPCMEILPVLSPSPYAILHVCIEQVSTIENFVHDVMV